MLNPFYPLIDSIMSKLQMETIYCWHIIQNQLSIDLTGKRMYICFEFILFQPGEIINEERESNNA